MLPSALAMPSTDSVVHGYRIAMTPDRLLGRAEAGWTTFAIVMATFAPLTTGYVIEEVSQRAAVGTVPSWLSRLPSGARQPADPQGAEHRRPRRGLALKALSDPPRRLARADR